jgi:hypothetical protein
MALKFDSTYRTAVVDALTTRVGGSGRLRVYAGTRPANVAAAITGNLLCDLPLNATFAPAGSAGVITLNSITATTVSGAGTQTATHFRIFQTGGTVACVDGDVTATGGGGDMELSTTSLANGALLTISSATFTAGGA